MGVYFVSAEGGAEGRDYDIDEAKRQKKSIHGHKQTF